MAWRSAIYAAAERAIGEMTMTKPASLLRVLALALALPSASAAFAIGDEIQVYTEEMDDPGEFGVETHINYVTRGARQPAYPGNMPSHHVLQVTPEFSYGISRTLEAGLYLPVAFAPGGHAYGNGLRLRLKYIAPREEGERWFWGLNGEYGYSARRVSESRRGLEFRPILGYRTEDWLFAVNPILNADLSRNADRKPKFEPALKVSRRVAGETRLGVEYYGEYGPVRHFLPNGERAHYLYGTLDFAHGDWDVNLGLGRGFVAAEDKWVIKAIVAFPFK